MNNNYVVLFLKDLSLNNIPKLFVTWDFARSIATIGTRRYRKS